MCSVEWGWGNPTFLSIHSTPLGNHIGCLYMNHSSNQSVCCGSISCFIWTTEQDVFLKGKTVIFYCEEIKYICDPLPVFIYLFLCFHELLSDSFSGTLKAVSSPLNFNLLFPYCLLCLVWNQWLANIFNFFFYFYLWCVQCRSQEPSCASSQKQSYPDLLGVLYMFKPWKVTLHHYPDNQ